MPDIDAINRTLQSEMQLKCNSSLTAVEAAGILDRAGLLADSHDRPGRELRRLLREGKIEGGRQLDNQRWFIHRELRPGDRVMLRSPKGEGREVGIVVCCWTDEELDTQDNYVAFFGDSFPKDKPDSMPYILRYLSTSLTLIDDVAIE